MSKPGSKQHSGSGMNPLGQHFMILLEWIGLRLSNILTRLWGAFPEVKSQIASPGITDTASCKADSEWKTNEALRTYHPGDGEEITVTVQTSTCAFHVSRNQTIQVF